MDTTHLRRSSRCNKYDGFRVPPLTDKKIHPSKVKPRKQPSVHFAGTATAPSVNAHEDGGHSAQSSSQVSVDIPPPTPIATIQQIGTNWCGIPTKNLSPRKLLAKLQSDKGDTS